MALVFRLIFPMRMRSVPCMTRRVKAMRIFAMKCMLPKTDLHEHPGANAVNDLREIIMAGWQGVLKDDPEKALNDIERMDWDRRLSEGEADEMGADECLGCVRGMLMAVQGHSPVHAAMWGERVIDFLDYENAPPVQSAAEHEA